MWLVLLIYALFASVFTVGKVTLDASSPFFLTGIRMLLAGGILLLFQRIKNPSQCYIRKEHIPLLLLIALFNVFITNAFEFWALQYMDSAKTCLIYSLSPFVSILLSYLFLSEKMTMKKWIGISIGFLGFIPIYLTSTGNEKELLNFGSFSLAEIAVTISAITCIFGWIFMKKLTQIHHYPFVMANAVSFLLAGAFSLITSGFLENWNPLPVTSFTPFLWGVIYIAIVHNVICYNLYAFCLQKFSLTFLAFAGFSNPVFTALYGWYFLDEPIHLTLVVSFVCILLGLALYAREELKKSKELDLESN